jgi:hypothetical protein
MKSVELAHCGRTCQASGIRGHSTSLALHLDDNLQSVQSDTEQEFNSYSSFTLASLRSRTSGVTHQRKALELVKFKVHLILTASSSARGSWTRKCWAHLHLTESGSAVNAVKYRIKA